MRSGGGARLITRLRITLRLLRGGAKLSLRNPSSPGYFGKHELFPESLPLGISRGGFRRAPQSHPGKVVTLAECFQLWLPCHTNSLSQPIDCVLYEAMPTAGTESLAPCL